MTFTMTISKASRVEVEFRPDKSDPLYSFLELTIYHPNAERPDKIQLFPSDLKASDHLHDIFLLASAANLKVPQ